MKRYAFLLSAALLLTGCAADTEGASQQTSSAAEEMTSETEQTTSATEQTTTLTESTTAPTESEPIKETPEYTQLTPIELSYEVTAAFDEEKIMSALSYDIPVDITTDPDYQVTRDYVATLPEEEQQMWLSQNYHSVSLNYIYAGAEKGDWLAIVSYSPCYYDGIHDAYYTSIFFSDGENIGEELFTTSDCGTIRVDSEVYICGEKLWCYDLETMELEVIYDTYSSYLDSTEDYIIFAGFDDYRLKIYNRETGNIITTNIYQARFDGTLYKLTDSEILYDSGDFENEYVKAVDLATGEERPTKYGYVHLRDYTLENDLYSLDRERDDTDWTEFTVTDKDTGEQRTYSISTFPDEVGISATQINGRGILNENWLYIRRNNDEWLALDLAENRIGKFDIGGNLSFEDYGMISTSDEGKRVFELSVIE